MSTLFRTTVAVATFAITSLAVAANQTPPGAVVVTATRTAQTADETLASVSVITREDIERRQVRSVQELLSAEPGVSIVNNGGLGKVTSIFMRGAESDHTLVLVDGLKVNSATSGGAAFQDIPIEQIERIEIVRGPRSSLYGSEAIGGVIQIFTRKGGGPLRPSFSATGGTHDYYNTSAGVSGGGDNAWFNVYANALGTDGTNACRGSLTGGCFTNEPDNDGYRNVSGSVRGGYRFDKDTELDLHWLRAEGDNEFDGSFQNQSKTTQEAFGGTFRFAPNTAWRSSLSTGRTQDASDNYKNQNFVGHFRTSRDSVSWQNDFTLSTQHLLTAGVDYQGEHVTSSTAYPVTSRNNNGIFAQHQGNFGAHRTELSLRRDDNEQFGHHTTGGVAWGYEFEKGPRLMASFGTAFKAPTFNELYFPTFGNSSLQPEESRSVEVGVSDTTTWGHWAINAFRTDVTDLIGTSGNTQVNVDKARIEGIETRVGTTLHDWILGSQLTLLDPENRSSGSNYGKTLNRRAKESFSLDADRAFGSYRLGTSLRAAGRRYDDLANTRGLGGYTVVDLRGEYAIDKRWLLQARIENLFDKEYELAEFYNQPDRGFFLTLRYQPTTAQ